VGAEVSRRTRLRLSWAVLALLVVGACLGVAHAEDPADGLSTGEVAGLGGVGLLLTGLTALARRQEFLALLGAVASLVTGQRQAADGIEARLARIEAGQTRTRRTVGLAADPDEPAPGSGLLVDVAALGSRLSGLEGRMDRLTAAVEAANQLQTETLAALAATHGSHDADR
jgi:hypothetical protein